MTDNTDLDNLDPTQIKSKKWLTQLMNTMTTLMNKKSKYMIERE
jgi:hypothetical protein